MRQYRLTMASGPTTSLEELPSVKNVVKLYRHGLTKRCLSCIIFESVFVEMGEYIRDTFPGEPTGQGAEADSKS